MSNPNERCVVCRDFVDLTKTHYLNPDGVSHIQCGRTDERLSRHGVEQ